MRLRQHDGEIAPTPQQLRALAAYLSTGSNRRAAAVLGIAQQTVKNHVHEAVHRLGHETPAAAGVALGWIRVPGMGEFDVAVEPYEIANRLRMGIADARRYLERVEAAQENDAP